MVTDDWSGPTAVNWLLLIVKSVPDIEISSERPLPTR